MTFVRCKLTFAVSLPTFALSVMVAAISFAGDATPTSPDKQREVANSLIKLELDWANSVEQNDVESIGRYLHPDFTFTSPTGIIANRKDHLKDFRDGNSRFTLVALSEVKVRVYGQTAVATSRPTINGTVKVGDKVISLRFQGARWTDSLVLQNGPWTCVARQQSNIPPPATKTNIALEELLKEKVEREGSQAHGDGTGVCPGGQHAAAQPSWAGRRVHLGGSDRIPNRGRQTDDLPEGRRVLRAARGKHLISRNASQIMPARFLAYFLTPTDEPLSIPEPSVRPTTAPDYDTKGHLKLPIDFRTWVFVGSNIGLQYRKDAVEATSRENERHHGATIGDFHNVYINPEAYDHYLTTGKFPEKTVLVMDVFEAKEKESTNIVSGGYFPGVQRGVEVAVKNSNRPDGSATDWAYYAFPDPARPVPTKAFPDTECYRCHKQHADDDNVWVRFYPLLRKDKAVGDK